MARVWPLRYPSPMAGPRPPSIILMEPQLAENIGAAARVMANFGLEDLRIVRPRDGWPQERAWAAASGAGDAATATREVLRSLL